MKKIYFLVFVFCFSFLFSYSQTPDWVWARSAQNNATGGGEGYSIATDKSNNVYITGYYGGTITFGSNVLTSPSSECFYLAKYDASGNVIWAKSAVNSSTGSSNGYNVCTDVFGNAYVTGFFDHTVSFGPYSLASVGYEDIFLVKYDSTGNVLWAKSAGGTNWDYGYGVSSDRSGNVYITGYFNSQTITFGSYILTNSGAGNIFLTKYDSSGNVQWAKSAVGSSDDAGKSIATDALANVYITGYFDSPSITFGSYTLPSTGGGDIFLAKYDSSGNVLWARRAGGASNDRGTYVVADSSGNAYLTGIYQSASITFGSYTLVISGVVDAFLVKYDFSGNVNWAKSIGGAEGYCVATDKSYRIYITGAFSSDTILFDTIIVLRPVVYSYPMYLAAYDSAGSALFAKALGGGADDQNAVAASPSGCIYIGGDFEQPSFIIGNDTLTRFGINENVFVAKLCYSAPTANFTTSATNICAEGNNCINFTDNSVGNPTSWQWHFFGASPDTSTQQNPTNICYYSPGTYPVILVVSNSSGTDTLNAYPMIYVYSAIVPTITISHDTLFSSHSSGYQWYFNGSPITNATDSFYIFSQGGTYSVQTTDSLDCSATSIGILITATEEISDGGITVYPNPANKSAVVSIQSSANEAVELKIIDITGREVYARQLQTSNLKLQTILDVSSLPAGVYLIRIDWGEQTINKKFVVLH